LTPQAFTGNGYNIYTSSLANNPEFGIAFLVDSKFNHIMLINFTPINERLCVIRIKSRFFNFSLINKHAPTNDSEEEAKDQFFEQLKQAYEACPSHDVKLVMGDTNAKVGRESVHQPKIGKHSLHESTNENGLRLVDFVGKWRSKVRTSCTNESTSKPGHTFNQIDHYLIDGRHFSDVIDVMARRGANIDSDHMLVVIKLRGRICRASNTKLQQLRRFAVGRLKDRDVAPRYSDELQSQL
jgi:endonuclease/exonuclease/phosphatase family metal-dependent hydrolase